MKLGRNDCCWCGSGKKYKRCHLNREVQEPLGVQDILDAFNNVYETGDCLHPKANSLSCRGKIVRAHTIQRNGGLNKIAREGHVYNALKHGRLFPVPQWTVGSNPNLVGIREASTFTGFCAKHDNELFAPLEKAPFVGTLEQIGLLGYRAICYELFMKQCDQTIATTQRELDKGTPVVVQRQIQEEIYLHQAGVSKAINELLGLKARYDQILQEGHFENLGYYTVKFNALPEVMCSAVAQATHDFSGNSLHQLGYLDTPASWLTFSLIATDDGGAAVFSWPADHATSEEVIRTLCSLSDEETPHAVVRFIFEFFENTYFSPEWWHTLEKPVQASLMKRQLSGPSMKFPRSDECLVDDGIRAVNWPLGYRLTSLISP